MSNYYNYFQLIPKFQSKNMYKFLCYSVICYLLKMSDRRKCYRSNTTKFHVIFAISIFSWFQKTDTLKMKVTMIMCSFLKYET